MTAFFVITIHTLANPSPAYRNAVIVVRISLNLLATNFEIKRYITVLGTVIEGVIGVGTKYF